MIEGLELVLAQAGPSDGQGSGVLAHALTQWIWRFIHLEQHGKCDNPPNLDLDYQGYGCILSAELWAATASGCRQREE